MRTIISVFCVSHDFRVVPLCEDKFSASSYTLLVGHCGRRVLSSGEVVLSQTNLATFNVHTRIPLTHKVTVMHELKINVTSCIVRYLSVHIERRKNVLGWL